MIVIDVRPHRDAIVVCRVAEKDDGVAIYMGTCIEVHYSGLVLRFATEAVRWTVESVRGMWSPDIVSQALDAVVMKMTVTNLLELIQEITRVRHEGHLEGRAGLQAELRLLIGAERAGEVP